MMTETEIDRRVARVYDMALAAAEREECVVELTDDEAKTARDVLREVCGAELKLTG